LPLSKGVGRKISRGGRQQKRLKNNKKRLKIALLSLFRRGGNGKKAVNSTAVLSLYYICTIYENPGEYGSPTLRCRRLCLFQ